jgi:hypothetical protein
MDFSEFETETQNSPTRMDSRSSSDEDDEKYDRAWYQFWANLRDTACHQFGIEKLRKIRREAEELQKDDHFALKFFSSLRWVRSGLQIRNLKNFSHFFAILKIFTLH